MRKYQKKPQTLPTPLQPVHHQCDNDESTPKTLHRHQTTCLQV